MYCLHNGLFCENKITLEKIAKEYKLSKERIRQLSAIDHVRKILFSDFPINMTSYSGLLDKSYFLSDDVEYVKLKETQKLPCDFKCFCLLLGIYSNFKYMSSKDVEACVSDFLLQSMSHDELLKNVLKLR